MVWESVKALLAAEGDLKKKIVKKQAEAEQDNADLVKQLARLQKEKERCEAERFENMDRFMDGDLDQETYQSRRAELSEEAAGLEKRISDMEVKLQEMETIRDDGTKEALETMEQYQGATELDQKNRVCTDR